MRKRSVWITLTVILILVLIYFSGPSPESPAYNTALPAVPGTDSALSNYIRMLEEKHKIKQDNEARIIWADSSHRRTPYAIVYLHGFSASQKEGDPVHRRFATEFGCNLYLSRLADHGVDTTESLQLFTAERLWETGKQALAIGKQLGEKVILMSTSTGGTLALKLAAEFPNDVHGLINLSPNIAINNPAAFLLNDPWGLQIARMVMGGKYRNTGASEEKGKYWNTQYRLESVVQLQELVESTMTEETFSKVNQPTLTLYYYKSEEEQDPEVKVSAMLEMHEQLATPADLKVAKAVPSAGAHVIGGSLASKDVETVYKEICEFAITKLRMQSVTGTLVSK